MCGVVGIFNLNGEPVVPSVLKSMTDQIRHRGPDSEGFHIDSFLGLGHRRLSIIDLSPAGHQPMVTEDGRFIISYNGEVYNHAKLRTELEHKGHVFRSSTDTEVVLKMFQEYGPASFRRLNGMFGLAIWDKRELTLTIARDRYGIKPLYYTLCDRTLLVGSEIKAFFQHPRFHVSMDAEALAEYLCFQNFYTDRTLFKGVRLLPAASYMQLSLGANELPASVRFWDYEFSGHSIAGDENSYVEEVNRLFTAGVKRQLMSDVELGAYLSGGIDSGSITSQAARYLPYLKTFTCGFDLSSASGLEVVFDERAVAEQMSYQFKTEHYEIVLKAGDMERAMPNLVWHLEEPRVGQCYPGFYAAKLASKFVKVVLSGAGGDEIFAGYPWRYYRAAVANSFDEYLDTYFDFWQRLIPGLLLPDLMKPVLPSLSASFAKDIFRGVFGGISRELTSPENYIDHSLYFEAKTFLHGLLVVEDKLSMAHGLEARVPFLDNDLVDFSQKIPVHLKLGNLGDVVRLKSNGTGEVGNYFEKSRDGKLILRKVVERYVPGVIAQREKQGFSAPDASWFKGDSIQYVQRKLLEGKPRLYDFIDRKVVVPLLNEHLEGRKNRRLLIWSLVYLQNWIEQFLGRPRSELTGPVVGF